MSAQHAVYSTTAPNAVYANRALSHAAWAASVTVVMMLLSSFAHDFVNSGPIALVWALWMGFEFAQTVRYGVKSVRAGIRDGQVLGFSVREARFVSIREEDAL
uniref:Uncharacterized protein n=1 Tax=Dulem virus 38 TaxID=3145756 RepID=A0AAU8B458_9CAUD